MHQAKYLLLIALVLGAVGARSESWVVIGTDPNGEMTIDTDSVVPGERYVDAITRYSQKTPSVVDGKEYLVSVTHARFDCGNSSYAAKRVEYYGDAKARGTIVHTEPAGENLKFLFPAKNSHGEEVIRVACERFRRP